MTKKFLISNLYLYLLNFLNFFLSYFLILICTKYLNKVDYFQFTGFISIINIIVIPISCMTISLSGIYKNKIIDSKNFSKAYSQFLFLFLFLFFIFFLIEKFFNFSSVINIEKKTFFFVISFFLLSFFFGIELSKYLGQHNFKIYSILNSTPFLLRTFLILILFVFFNLQNFNTVGVSFIIGLIFLLKKYLETFKKYFSIPKINEILKINNLNFLKNLFNIGLFTFILNYDVILIRNFNEILSNSYYISALFGKIFFFLSTISVLFMYPTNLKNKRNSNFSKILFLHFLLSVGVFVFYILFLDKFFYFFFPNQSLNFKDTIFVSIFCLFFSFSNIISYKLNIVQDKLHIFAKIVFTIIFLFLSGFVNSKENTIFLLIVLSIIFVISDCAILLKKKRRFT